MISDILEKKKQQDTGSFYLIIRKLLFLISMTKTTLDNQKLT